jgi:signal transduction histidine kinase
MLALMATVWAMDGPGAERLAAWLPWTGVGVMVSASLLWGIKRGAAWAAHPAWLVFDALLIVIVLKDYVAAMPGLAALLALPVCAMAMQAGWRVAALFAVAVVIVTAALQPASVLNGRDMDSHGAMVMLLSGLLIGASVPMARWLARPARAAAKAQALFERLQAQPDQQRGLGVSLNAALHHTYGDLNFAEAEVLMNGFEIQGYRWRAETGLSVLEGHDLRDLRRRIDTVEHAATLARAPHDVGSVAQWYARGGSAERVDDLSAWLWLTPKANGAMIRLPSLSGGHGGLWLKAAPKPFDGDTVAWLRRSWLQIMPLLEHAELMEQLKRQMAMSERARIGRDLHDSAVQPYVGLKFGLEALARQVGPGDAAYKGLQQLAAAAHAELQSLRELISGLRRGDDVPLDTTSLVDLETQSRRFESLYGLRVAIFAPQAHRIRGALAAHVQHLINEGLSNAKRHANATAATVLIDVDDDFIRLRMRNDHGHGGKRVDPALFTPTSIRERALALGATVDLQQEDDMTEVSIDIPADSSRLIHACHEPLANPLHALPVRPAATHQAKAAQASLVLHPPLRAPR